MIKEPFSSSLFVLIRPILANFSMNLSFEKDTERPIGWSQFLSLKITMASACDYK
jgi:hypothetical protein